MIDDFFIDLLGTEFSFSDLVFPTITTTNDNSKISIEYFKDNAWIGNTYRTKKVTSFEDTLPISESNFLSYTNTGFPFNPSKILYFPFGINSKYFLELQGEKNDRIKDWTKLLEYYYCAFPESMDAFEKQAFAKVEKYQKLNADYKLHLVKLLENGEKIDVLKELDKWQKQNKNTLLDEAVYLDKLLNKFHLRTKTILDSVDEINSIQLESMVFNETIPFENLSSGTRQILSAARPIYHLLEKDAIVLTDEPETSLYRDLQRDIISYYTNLRDDLKDSVQYFFATHSPVIASSFDPWEIIDLEFDETGFVKRHLYYEGEENHVDNISRRND